MEHWVLLLVCSLLGSAVGKGQCKAERALRIIFSFPWPPPEEHSTLETQGTEPMWVDGPAQLLSLHLELACESLCPQCTTSGSNHQDQHAGRRFGAPMGSPCPHPHPQVPGPGHICSQSPPPRWLEVVDCWSLLGPRHLSAHLLPCPSYWGTAAEAWARGKPEA